MTLMRSHSTPSALTDRRFSTGNVIVLLRHLPKLHRETDSGAQRLRPTRQPYPLTRSHRSQRPNSAPVHINPDHHAVLKSP